MSSAETLEHVLGPHSLEEWHNAPESTDGSRLELVWGHWHVSPAPGIPHQHITGLLYRAIGDALTAAGRVDLHAIIGAAVDISTPTRTGLIPDIAVVDAPLMGAQFPAEALLLAVEVWSPGNTRIERDLKVSAYATAGVPYLWLVEFTPGVKVNLRGYELTRGGYRQIISNATNDETIAMPGPVPVAINIAHLLPW